MVVLALFQPNVVVNADAGQSRNFFSAETGNTTTSKVGETGIFRSNKSTTRLKVLAESRI